MNFFLKKHNKWVIVGLSLLMLIFIVLVGAIQRERVTNVDHAEVETETTEVEE